jgi:hypothetical protein
LAEATIRRTLVISGTHELRAVSLAERLRQLLAAGGSSARFRNSGEALRKASFGCP